MNYYYITFATNHNSKHSPDQIQNRIIRIYAKHLKQANYLAIEYFDGLFAMIYEKWTFADSKRYAPLGITHELRWENSGRWDIEYEMMELDEPIVKPKT